MHLCLLFISSSSSLVLDDDKKLPSATSKTINRSRRKFAAVQRRLV
ncbi:unnamed protein product [Brassica oleracea var. botrytis]